MRSISIAHIFQDNQSRLDLRWEAGLEGRERTLHADGLIKPVMGQVGHMNFIHPFAIQLLGVAEMDYLSSLEVEAFEATVLKLLNNVDLAALIIANDRPIPPFMSMQCDALAVPLLSSPQPSPHIVDVLWYYLSRVLAEETTLHGVFLDVLETGVLITGQSTIGKSELALELITRGHGLIADDMVTVARISPDTVEGRCPAMLRDFLEVRGIGILNIRTIFGETAVRPRKVLSLIVHLEHYSEHQFAELDRLSMTAVYQEVLKVPVRKITLPVAAGRNLAVLVEAAVRNYLLQARGIDSTKEFIERQQQWMLGEGVS
jgi:HPr kinase/phosphorylase